MGYKLQVEPLVDNRSQDWRSLYFWDRFMDESGYLDHNNTHNIDYYLAPYRAKNCRGEPYIEFESEGDALLFLLRWK
jgi:hypothetical protein